MFFDTVEDFKCPECDAPRSAFYDANDKDDPHNQQVTRVAWGLAVIAVLFDSCCFMFFCC